MDDAVKALLEVIHQDHQALRKENREDFGLLRTEVKTDIGLLRLECKETIDDKIALMEERLGRDIKDNQKCLNNLEKAVRENGNGHNGVSAGLGLPHLSKQAKMRLAKGGAGGVGIYMLLEWAVLYFAKGDGGLLHRLFGG